MDLRGGTGSEFALRGLAAGCLAAFMLLLAALPASAQLLPEGFFEQTPAPGHGAAAVEADKMSYDSANGLIDATGGVVVSYKGYTIRADTVEYDQKTDGLHAVGHVTMVDPQGNHYQMESVELTGGMKEAFINSLTLTTVAGAVITARDTHYTSALITTLTDATYSPCGQCIDPHGHRIGWQVKATQITYDRKHAAVYMNNPTLELLGMPVAWIPWLWIPDPTQPRATGLRMPTVGYDSRRGAEVSVPYFVPVGEDVDILLAPRLMSRQGFLMKGDVDWRLPGLGEVTAGASGLYQLDKNAYAGKNGYRDWRGAAQTTGRFTPTKEWTVGWSYTAFTDNGYLKDYSLTDQDTSVNEAYATYLTDNTYGDLRVQEFKQIDDTAKTNDPAQAKAVPLGEVDHVQDLAPGYGRINVTAQLVSLNRGADQTGTTGAAPHEVPYVYGYEGSKQHLEVEGAWENQWILPGGVTATPYLGARVDAAYYDGSSSRADAPDAGSRLALTPIAAMDFRWPLISTDGADTQLLEPIAQLVYRGSSTTKVGITNDDSQSFVFDTSNLFSYNRFSGIDRQETGLRANLGAHYLATLSNGAWLDLLAGQSFHIAGTNALDINDAAQVGASTGLGDNASYIVASATGGLPNGLSGGAKVQVDPASPRVTHAGVGVAYAGPWLSGNVSYTYTAANGALGTGTDHEIATNLSLPLAEYWSVQAGYGHNILTNSWASATGGVTYDDGYLRVTGAATAKPDSYAFTLHAGLKGPDGTLAAF